LRISSHSSAADLLSFQRLYDDQLSPLPELRQLTSTIVTKIIVEHRPIIDGCHHRSALNSKLCGV
jgi:hypothetical protein